MDIRQTHCQYDCMKRDLKLVCVIGEWLIQSQVILLILQVVT